MKRGVDKETETQLSAELYAPKVDARDSYTPNYSSNYQRDPYYPNYDPYPKTTFSSSSSSSSSYSPYYTNNPQTTTASYSTLPYNVYNTYTNPYASSTSHSSIPSTAYTTSPYSTTAYPPSYTSNPYTAGPSAYQAPPYVPVSSYYYQQPYYYPSYYSPALYPPPPPPPPFPHPDYSKDSGSDNKESYEKDSNKSKKSKSKNEDKNQDSSDNEYVDNGNYISTNSKDLDSQSSSYKAASSYNQLEQTNNDAREQNSGSGAYKIIKLSTQPSDTEYSIAATYAKTQQLEQLMRQTLAKLLAENAARHVIRYPTYDTKQNLLLKANEVSYGGLGDYDTRNTQTFVTASNPIVKNGLSYAINSNNLGNINSGSILPRSIYQNPLTRSVKYSEDQYNRKPITVVTLQQSQGSYIPPNKSVKAQVSTQSSSYDGYENEDKLANHNYDSTLNSDTKQEQDYDQGQTTTSYKNQNYVTVQTPQSYSYQYASYHPQQTTNQQGSQEYDDGTTDGEFGAKQNNKG
ncbi:PREDICTED: signaling mucin HKR1-like [Polistes dominula]|uniref:Signaling mucin HKR1-like n=1 Tax=Polistes dominula TaxID=743375 RepID=A0ABM1I0Z4_POLDO|nr:PREDICTED: signaling mucin HKR1-like [Polistes dominula]